MPRRPDQNHYSHKVNILVLPVDENEVRNVPPSRQAEDKARAAREAKLYRLCGRGSDTSAVDPVAPHKLMATGRNV